MSTTLRKKFFAPYQVPVIVGLDYVMFFRTGGFTRYSLSTEATVATPYSESELYVRGASAGNAQFGMFVPGDSSNTKQTLKYQYATGAGTSGVALGVRNGNDRIVAAGNASICLIAVGYDGNDLTAQVRKYDYAANTSTVTTPLSATSRGCSTGNAQFGMFVYSASGATNRYEFAPGTVTAGPSVGGFGNGGAGTGNGEIGLITGTPLNMLNKVIFASNTRVPATSLPTERLSRGSITGSVVKSVINMGAGKACSTYTFADDTTANTTTAFSGITGPGVCANPVGVNV